MFESDFVDLQHRDTALATRALGDAQLFRQFWPKIKLEDQEVNYYPAKGAIPPNFTELHIGGPVRVTRLALKMRPDETMAAAEREWTLEVAKDVTLPAVASILKSAHLTLFHALGYRYALSAGGYFVGKTVLGDFFLRHHQQSKKEALRGALKHFAQFSAMVRPVASDEPGFAGSVMDRLVYVCKVGDCVWSLIVFVRTGTFLHSALIPIFDDPVAAPHFVNFLRADKGKLTAHLARIEPTTWSIAESAVTFDWPYARFVDSESA